jgi:hypothetical protein
VKPRPGKELPVGAEYPAYLANVVKTFNPQAVNTITLDLTQLDALMSSLGIR